MLSLRTTNTHILMSQHQTIPRLSAPRTISSLIFECNPKRRGENYKKSVSLLRRGFSFKEAERNLDNSWSCWCKQGEGDVKLEAEIMDFMEKSEKPTMFPTKRELIRGGRMDLVEAIKKIDGWYSLGWDEQDVGDNVDETFDLGNDIGEFQRRVGNRLEKASLREDENKGGVSSESNSNFVNLDSMQFIMSPSSFRSLEIDTEENSGIEGILSRLEKKRNNDFGLKLGINGNVAPVKIKDVGDDQHFGTSHARTYLQENGRLTPYLHQKGILNNSGENVSQNSEPETWRTWSNQRAGFQQAEFEAAEISFSKDRLEIDKESSHAEDLYKYEQIHGNQIRARLQHLECELNTALHSLRSKREECISEEVTVSSSDLQKLSDAWEFQENEFMSAKDRLRSIRAKLAVVEGKMSLSMIDAQNMIESRQKRIDCAHKALELLRTTFIVWPNSASEVLLAGSFDGWSSQRKMEKSRTGIFSLCLKLYPGRYTIKFIVDGVWKVDPLRPIMNNNGYENNLLIVT